MQWEDREESQNVEDRRGTAVKTGVAIGGGSILIVLLALMFGVDPQKLGGIINQGGGPQQQGDQDGNVEQRPIDPAEEKLAKFTKVIFGDTERVWSELFAQMGKTYQKPTLVLFSDAVNSACGTADSAVGPFYCPG